MRFVQSMSFTCNEGRGMCMVSIPWTLSSTWSFPEALLPSPGFSAHTGKTPPYTLQISQCRKRHLLFIKALLIESQVSLLPEGTAVQTEEVVRLVNNPLTASLKCSAKNTWASDGLLANSWSSSHLTRERQFYLKLCTKITNKHSSWLSSLTGYNATSFSWWIVF